MTVQSFQSADLTVSAAVSLPELPAEMAAIVQWANTASAAQALVERIVDTPFMPAAFWPKFDPRDREAAQRARQQAIASGTAAVLYGGPLGLNPLQALANIHVVKGKPGLPAELMVALVRSHGHEVAIEDLTDHRCRVWGRRSGEEQLHRAEFTIDRAKKAGYTAQNAKYGTDPQAMLYARAVSILCRQMAPEVLKGLATVEEIGDEPDPDAVQAKGTRTVQRQAAPAAAPVRTAVEASAPRAQGEPRSTPRPVSAAPVGAPATAGLPPLPGEEAALVGLQAHGAVREAAASTRLDGETQSMPDATADGITDAQLRKLGAVMGDLGVTGTGSRERRLAIAARIAGRDLGSSKDLTRDEAHLIIDTLDGIARGDDVAVRLDRLERGLPIEPTADHQGSPSDPMADARSHAADVEARIAAARAEVDERAAQQAAEAEQAEAYDPTAAEEWPS